MRRNVTLDPRVGVCDPSAANLGTFFEYGVVHNGIHVWKAMLELVCHQETGKPCTNSDDSDLPRGESQLIASGDVVRVILRKTTIVAINL